MAPRLSGNDQNSKPSKSRLPLFVGLAGVLLILLGSTIPGGAWNLLLFVLGFILIWASKDISAGPRW